MGNDHPQAPTGSLPAKPLLSLQQPGTSADNNPGFAAASASDRRLPLSTDDKLASVVRYGDLPAINHQLLDAAWHGSYDAVKALLDRGADPKICDSGHFTALHFATRNSNEQTGMLLNCLLNHGADLNALTALNRTPLQCAVICGNLSAVSTLLERGADPDIPDQFGFTPLNKAAAQGERQIVDKLLAHNANPDKSGVWTLNPLYKALVKQHTDIVHTLLAHGANPDPDLCNTSGRTMLNCLVEKLRPVAEVRLMLANGADPNTCSNSGQTTLNFVVNREDGCAVQLLKLLLANGADPNAHGEDGDTPLHVGVANDNLEFVRILMDNGANPSVRNQLGRTALKSAERGGAAPEIIDSLRNHIPVYQPGSLKVCARTCIRQRLVKNRTLLADMLSTDSDCLPLKDSLKAFVYNPLTI
ncbi:ankyrin repeat domain-containing protein [Endozoicomonas sp. YOMI1]|uniref:ankyrin repeat domain-containing protein n=1 Tax=Endozoicomonas sp. YOMI1 TaxID=2828739 RepID=UPI002147DB51|nr:ankyrin repeat domain-containing protein [Endozoicomonas sp. YOMI1]